MDNLNQKNSDWKPEEQITEPMGDSTEMSEKLGEAPGLCGCEECVHPDDINSQGTEEGGCVHAQTGSESNNLDKTYQKNNNAPVQSIYGGHPDGEKRTLSQITIPEGWKNQNPDEGNVMCGPDGQIILSKDETVGEEGVNAQTGSESNNVTQSSQDEGCLESNKEEDKLEFVTSSVRQRGNRNRSLLLREKREWMRQRRVNGYKRCDRVIADDVDEDG